jgi:hypothetical protein
MNPTINASAAVSLPASASADTPWEWTTCSWSCECGSLTSNPAFSICAPAALRSRAAGGLAALAGEYNHLLLLGPAMRGFFSTPAQMPGAVIEPLYVTDPFEGSIADSVMDQQVIASGIASAIERFVAR